MKNFINFIRNHSNIHTIIGTALLVVVLAAMLQLNQDILNMTRGCYNMFDILFM